MGRERIRGRKYRDDEEEIVEEETQSGRRM